MENRWNASACTVCGRRSTRIVACHAGSLRRNAAWMPGDLAREKGGGDFRQRLRALRRQAKTRVRRHADEAAHGFRLSPLRCAAASSSFRPAPGCVRGAIARPAGRTPAGHRPAAIRRRAGRPAFAQEIIAQARGRELRDGVTFRARAAATRATALRGCPARSPHRSPVRFRRG